MAARMNPDEKELRELNPEFFLLPPSIRESAVFQGKSVEAGWKRERVEAVIKAAAEVNLVNLGGQPQFQTPFGICEPYWLNFDASERKDGEPWADFVHRSSEEVLSQFKEMERRTNYIEVAKEWEILKEKIETSGWDPTPTLVFILYFQKEKE